MTDELKSIYLGNLPVDAVEADVAELFGRCGPVVKVTLVTERDTGASRGFGFVEMPAAAAEKAIAELDGFEFEGHTLRVNEARDRGAKPPRRSW